jgi:hypothetical protein
LTASKTRFASNTVSGTMNGCVGVDCGVGISLSPQYGYSCCWCNDPYPNTLFLTHDYGTATLPKVSVVPGDCRCIWEGCTTITRDLGCGQGVHDMTILLSVQLNCGVGAGAGTFLVSCTYAGRQFGDCWAYQGASCDALKAAAGDGVTSYFTATCTQSDVCPIPVGFTCAPSCAGCSLGPPISTATLSE